MDESRMEVKRKTGLEKKGEEKQRRARTDENYQ